jgi:D-threo-aldose 1-dehydrogenase
VNPGERVPVGATRVAVTRLALGSASLSGMFQPVTEEEAHATVAEAWAAGIRFFDTAPLYGLGEGERRLGRALAGRPREELVVSTKVGRPSVPGVEFDFSRDGVLRSFEASLERLALDRVDIVLLHDPEPRHVAQVFAEAYLVIAELRSAGVVGAIGAGVNGAHPFVELARELELDCCLLAGRYTLLDRSGGTEVLPLCEERDIAVFAAGIYNSGVLADPHGEPTYDYAPAASATVEQARKLAGLCASSGVPLKAAAIQFPFSHPAVVSVVSGSAFACELAENVELLQTPVPDELWTRLFADGGSP